MAVDIGDLKEARDPYGHRLYFRLDDGRQVCGSGLRRRPKNVRCGQTINLGENGRCKLHGGTNPGRPIVNGSRSIRNKSIQALFQELRARPDILDLRDGLATFDVRIAQLWEALETQGDCPDFRNEAARLCDKLAEAIAEDVPSKEIVQAAHALAAHVQRGVDDTARWDALLDLVERRSRRAEQALLSSLRGQSAVPARDVVVFLARVVDIVSVRTQGHGELGEAILHDISKWIGKTPAIPVEVLERRE